VVTGSRYSLVRLKNGTYSVHSVTHGETFHPVVGPVAEAEALYVRQLRLVERLQQHTGEFVIWDVGLGAAANVLTLLRAAQGCACDLRVVSFDRTLEPLRFALGHAEALGYFRGYEEPASRLAAGAGKVEFANGRQTVTWTVEAGDFPSRLAQAVPQPSGSVSTLQGARMPEHAEAWTPNQAAGLTSTIRGARIAEALPEPPPGNTGVVCPKADLCPGLPDESSVPGSKVSTGVLPPPHAILFDAFSPATNPEMWTLPLFTKLFRCLDPARPCAMPTYSRSTMLRVTLLLAGFYVGAGHATGEKEETTIAANTGELIDEPLDRQWLARARRSTSAEPLCEPVYRQQRLRPETWERLQAHPQFP